MWPKIIKLIIDYLKSRPRADLTAKVLALRDAMRDCNSSYVRFAAAKSRGGQSAIDASYRDWRGAFGILDTAVAEVDDVLDIFGPEARSQVNMYLMSESVPCAEDGYAVSAAIVHLLDEPPGDPQATTGKVEFSDALDTLNRFIAANFKPEEIIAALRPML